MEQFKASGDGPPLPRLTARHIFDWLMEAGPVESGAMGPVPLSWREIDAWAGRTFQRLSAWDTRTLRKLSAVYLAEIHAAEDQYRAAPWAPRGVEVDQAANERQLRAVLG